jgi:hypothetical protein
MYLSVSRCGSVQELFHKIVRLLSGINHVHVVSEQLHVFNLLICHCKSTISHEENVWPSLPR